MLEYIETWMGTMELILTTVGNSTMWIKPYYIILYYIKYHRPWSQNCISHALCTPFVVYAFTDPFTFFHLLCHKGKNLQSFGPFTRHHPSLLCLFGFARPSLWFQKRFLKEPRFTATGDIFVEKVTLKLCGGNGFVVSNTMDSKGPYVFLEVFCLV